VFVEENGAQEYCDGTKHKNGAQEYCGGTNHKNVYRQHTIFCFYVTGDPQHSLQEQANPVNVHKNSCMYKVLWYL
jgi:hypothetical protein